MINDSNVFSFMFSIIDETEGLFTSIGLGRMMFETLFHLLK